MSGYHGLFSASVGFLLGATYKRMARATAGCGSRDSQPCCGHSEKTSIFRPCSPRTEISARVLAVSVPTV
eukprot:1228382-Amphidinium_carterae.4